MDRWTEVEQKSTSHFTSVAAKDFLIDDCNNWETVKTVSEGLPKFDVVTAFA